MYFIIHVAHGSSEFVTMCCVYFFTRKVVNMSRVYKVSLYVTDPNNDCTPFDIGSFFDDTARRFKIASSNITVLCGENEFEWNDELPINFLGCPDEEWERYMGNPTKRVFKS